MFAFVYDPATNPLNNNDWAFPLLEIIHILGFGTLVGTIAIVDMGLLGWGKRGSAAQLLKETSGWTLAALVVMLISGPLIFTSGPVMYVHNYAFQFKMTALLIAILYNYTIHRKVALAGASPGVSKVVGVISLALWISVVFGGLFIGFIYAP